MIASLGMLSGGASAQVITEFSAGITHGATPQGIAPGPDGNVWFTERFGYRIGRITPSGVVTEFSTGITAGASPGNIVAGADGALWFTESGSNRIGRITTAGVVTEYTLPPRVGAPYGIASGSDGNLWFTVYTAINGNLAGAIGSISPTTHAITVFTAGISRYFSLYSIAAGSDGNLWFTEQDTAKIGRITVAGAVTEFPTSFLTGNSLAVITAGPDGNLWFASTLDHAIGRITTAGVFTPFTNGISASPLGIASGPDGNLWFTEGFAIGRITVTGTVSEFSSGITPGAAPTFITAGSDGNLWFSEDSADSIGRITTGGGGNAPAITSVASTSFTVGSAGTFTVTATGAPAPALSEAGALPNGVTFTAATGALSGTPAAGTAGSYPLTFTASNGVLPDATQNFTLTVNPANTSFTGPTATGTGSATVSFTGGGAGCQFTTAAFIPLSGGPSSPPAGSAPPGVTFPQGLLKFTTGGCAPAGATLAFTIVYPQSLPPGTVYWKYGPTALTPAPHWYPLPATIVGNTVTFSITDGGLGDDDLAANGVIVDQGGPGIPAGPGLPTLKIPTLSEWSLLGLAALLAVFGAFALRRFGPSATK